MTTDESFFPSGLSLDHDVLGAPKQDLFGQMVELLIGQRLGHNVSNVLRRWDVRKPHYSSGNSFSNTVVSDSAVLLFQHR